MDVILNYLPSSNYVVRTREFYKMDGTSLFLFDSSSKYCLEVSAYYVRGRKWSIHQKGE